MLGKKTGASWVQNKGLHYSWHSRRCDLHLLIISLPPRSTWAGQKQAQRNAAYTVGLCHSWGTVNHPEPTLQGCSLQICKLSLDGNTFIILHSKQIFPLSCRGNNLSLLRLFIWTYISRISSYGMNRNTKIPMKNCLQQEVETFPWPVVSGLNS